ncbi:tRNA pseudouridine(38-40) synthase [Trichophyton interdigitale MR816]|uniref:tRNA pseudouridine synthase 1 n=1 Tax=Trichophyton interdigitale (strain MR816) TaxID=1215338 RepID=A0A059J840_TRIIM|nr:tRNA pseudouridine(38-40) synthase [Trichophyton interdigitale H6]KDB24010.1 tRNA pseudouridine(38-40) synthase [Trichophyton interdigitale MR816]
MDSAVQNPSPGENSSKQDPSTSQATVADQAGEQKMDSSAAGRGGRNKQKDMGRKAYRNKHIDRRAANDRQEAKRRKIEQGENPMPIYATQFSQEDIDADVRRPKKKVIVMLGYSGTGYHGMQLCPTEKTIEGDLFAAFVAANAISKANAVDPKKSSFVRCARTDKGVHAAGNVVSLKLIIEDPDIVQKINEKLNPQIRVWGIIPATKGFSAYQFCDSRMYEYLIPSHCFLPPHPSTFLAQKMVEMAEKHGDMEAFRERQAEVESYWEETDKKHIQPIIDALPEKIKPYVQAAVGSVGGEEEKATPANNETEAGEACEEQTESDTKKSDLTPDEQAQVNVAIKDIRTAYFKAKNEYRIPPERLARINSALALYVGTKNFHNYTIQKTFRDPSARRLIKSFKISRDPVVINGTEWLSLKVHGQSFMMHQIRKMVAMVALLVRCGADIKRIEESYQNSRIPIPKAPGLGLLLERPIFDGYNKKAKDLGRELLDFDKYEKEMDEFKLKEIYQRIFTEEAEKHAFGTFFNHIDSYKENTFLYVTSGGLAACSSSTTQPTAAQEEDARKAESKVLAEVESESEAELVDNGEDGG